MYDRIQTGVQFVASLVDTDMSVAGEELDIHDLAAVTGAQSLELRLLFEDPSGMRHVRPGTAGRADDQDEKNDNDIIWINTSSDILLNTAPIGRWRLTAEATWYANADGSRAAVPTVLHRVVSPRPVLFYTRGPASPPSP